MKKNGTKALFAVAIIVLNLLAAQAVLLGGNTSQKEHQNLVTEARSLARDALYGRALMKYKSAQSAQDSLQLRKEMVSVYINGLENGEFTNAFELRDMLLGCLDTFGKEPAAYDFVGQTLFNRSDYEACVDVLHTARTRGVRSAGITKLTEKVRYKFEENYSQYVSVSALSDGYYVCADTKTYGFLADDLGTAVGVDFDYAAPFGEGYALVRKNASVFLIDSAGLRMSYFPDNIEAATGAGNGLLACKTDDVYSYFGLDGKKRFGAYQYAGRFANGLAAVKEDAGWRVIQPDGAPLSKETYDGILLDPLGQCFVEDRLFVQYGEKYHMVDMNLQPVNQFVCEAADIYPTGGWAAFCQGGKWGFVDMQGNVKIKPTYKEARAFSSGLAAVKTGDLWGFIDTSGAMAIAAAYEDAGYFNESGACFVKKDGIWKSIQIYYLKKMHEF
jgi:hypothetical protein